MNPLYLRLPLLAAAIAGLLVTIRVAVWPLASVQVGDAPERPAASAHPTSESSGHDSSAVIVSRDPFRILHRPALPAYDPLHLADQLAPPPPRPVLRLVGVVTGADPSAVVEGLPGVDGSRVLRVGDVVGGLRVKQIDRRFVVINGMDTTWSLEVREPWKP